MTFPNSSTAFAAVVVDELIRGGVSHLVLSPGSRSGALAIAALREPKLTVTVAIDERSAAFHALGIGRATQRPAAVLTTSGSAVAHLFPAIVEAHMAMVPLVLLTADRPPELHGVGANQTILQAGIFGHYTHHHASVGPPDHDPSAPQQWRTAVARAVVAASSGPVQLNLAFREPLVPETDDGRDRDRPFVFDTDGRPGGDPWERKVTDDPLPVPIPERYLATERGVVVAGESPSTSVADVDRLAAALGWPLIAEPTIGGRPPQAISTAHHLLSDPAIAEVLRPDVAIVIGRPTLSRPVSQWLGDIPRLVVDSRLERPPGPTAELTGGPLVAPAPLSRSGEWRRRWLRIEAVGRQALDVWLDAHPDSEPAIARDVARGAGEGPLLVASSMPVRDLDLAMGATPVRVFCNRGASGIDGFASTAFGVATGLNRPVVALGGDVAMLHDSNGFLVDPRPDVVFVVVNNNGGGIFSFLPQRRQGDVFERAFGTPHDRSFELLASFHGIGYEVMTEPTTQVAVALARGGSWLLEARSEREANVRHHQELSRTVVAAVRHSLEG